MTPVFLVGDVHGDFDGLIRAVKQHDVRDCILICVGDFGVGFYGHKEMSRLVYLNRFFNERGIKFKSIRGNHDDPSYWTGEERVVLENLELIEDYTYKTIDDRIWLFVGGAISVDRIDRTLNRSYWSDEEFVLKHNLIEKCDVLVTHSAPTWNGPIDKTGIQGYCNRDSRLWAECTKERNDHDQLIRLCRPTHHYCGHFHLSSTSFVEGTKSKIIDILEIVEHR